MGLKSKSVSNGSNELNFIGTGTSLEGTIETNGSLRIDGRVKGTVKSSDTVTIGSGGEVNGEIYARNAIVGGKIEGNIIVEEKLVLESTSVLTGNLRAGKLIIDEGAVFNGKSEMGGSAAASSGKFKFGKQSSAADENETKE